MASATAGVSQPRAGLRPQGLFELRLGTFNFGMTQQMIDSQQWRKTHCVKFESTLVALVEGGELDALFGCEVGGHKQGLSQERLARAISAFARGGTESKATQNYIRAWNFGVGGHSGATQPAAARLRLESTTCLTLSNRALEPKLVVDTFLLEHVRGADHLRAYLVVGNLHLRTPNKKSSPSVATRLRVVKEALQEIGSIASAVDLPSVCQVLLGDVNLKEHEAETAVAQLHPRCVDASFWPQFWQVFRSSAGLGGADKGS